MRKPTVLLEELATGGCGPNDRRRETAATGDLDKALDLIRRAQVSLKTKLTPGQIRDLLKDNFDWSSPKCNAIGMEAMDKLRETARLEMAAKKDAFARARDKAGAKSRRTLVKRADKMVRSGNFDDLADFLGVKWQKGKEPKGRKERSRDMARLEIARSLMALGVPAQEAATRALSAERADSIKGSLDPLDSVSRVYKTIKASSWPKKDFWIKHMDPYGKGVPQGVSSNDRKSAVTSYNKWLDSEEKSSLEQAGDEVWIKHLPPKEAAILKKHLASMKGRTDPASKESHRKFMQRFHQRLSTWHDWRKADNMKETRGSSAMFNNPTYRKHDRMTDVHYKQRMKYEKSSLEVAAPPQGDWFKAMSPQAQQKYRAAHPAKIRSTGASTRGAKALHGAHTRVSNFHASRTKAHTRFANNALEKNRAHKAIYHKLAQQHTLAHSKLLGKLVSKSPRLKAKLEAHKTKLAAKMAFHKKKMVHHSTNASNHRDLAAQHGRMSKAHIGHAAKHAKKAGVATGGLGV